MIILSMDPMKWDGYMSTPKDNYNFLDFWSSSSSPGFHVNLRTETLFWQRVLKYFQNVNILGMFF